MPTKRGWVQHETDMAEMFNLRTTVTSGNKWFDPGDAVTPGGGTHPFPIFLDAKYTEAKAKSVSLKDLQYYTDRATMMGRRMVLALRFFPKDAKDCEDYVLLSAHDFRELLDKAGA